MRADIVSVIEAAYRMDVDVGEWLDGIAVSALPTLDLGLGTLVYDYDASDPARMRVGAMAAAGTPHPFEADGMRVIIESADAAYVRASWRSVPCALASRTEGIERQRGWAMLREAGVADMFAVNGLDPSGLGCWLGAPVPKSMRLDVSTKRRWSRVAAHLATALRLRRKLATTRSKKADPSRFAAAVLAPGGGVKHTEGDAKHAVARDALRRAAIAIDRARGRMRRADVDGSLDAWRGLVDARWSLVDHFESDGKRYVIACANEPGGPALQRLSARERQVSSYASFGLSNKQIAYVLGLSDSTVRVLVSRAAAKLGVSTRGELARVVAGLLEVEGRRS